MLRFLFSGLTANQPRGAPLFAAVVAEARRPFWYADIGVSDTLDGRFSVLATVTALATLRLERGGPDAQNASVALAERFIESMEHEHRQLGYGDPTLGKIVRRLTGSLARRVELFRKILDDGDGWEDGATASLKDLDPSLRGSAAEALQDLWARLDRMAEPQLVEGTWA